MSHWPPFSLEIAIGQRRWQSQFWDFTWFGKFNTHSVTNCNIMTIKHLKIKNLSILNDASCNFIHEGGQNASWKVKNFFMFLCISLDELKTFVQWKLRTKKKRKECKQCITLGSYKLKSSVQLWHDKVTVINNK